MAAIIKDIVKINNINTISGPGYFKIKNKP